MHSLPPKQGRFAIPFEQPRKVSWVKNATSAQLKRCPLIPQKQTFVTASAYNPISGPQVEQRGN